MYMIFYLIKLLFIKLLHKVNLISDDYYEDSIIYFIKTQGIVFIKLAQIVGSRNDMKNKLNPNFLEKIRKLQDKCYYDVKNKVDINDVIYIDNKPIGSGSIASVYLVKFKNGMAVLKKNHDNISNDIENSKSNLKILINLLNIFTDYNLTNIIDFESYLEYLKSQTDMVKETNNLIRFNEIFKDKSNIYIPNVKHYQNDYLIMEYCPGIKMNDFILEYPEYEYEAVSLMYASVIHMIKNNVLHGDFHYGNFLFKLENKEVKLIILDFGIICNLSDFQSECILNCLNPKKNENFRTENGLNFIKSLNVDTKNINIKGKRFEEILDQIIEKDIKIQSEFYSSLTTLQTILSNTQHLIDNDKDFIDFLAGYLMENEYI